MFPFFYSFYSIIRYIHKNRGSLLHDLGAFRRSTPTSRERLFRASKKRYGVILICVKLFRVIEKSSLVKHYRWIFFLVIVGKQFYLK